MNIVQSFFDDLPSFLEEKQLTIPGGNLLSSTEEVIKTKGIKICNPYDSPETAIKNALTVSAEVLKNHIFEKDKSGYSELCNETDLFLCQFLENVKLD